nr:MAG: VP6 [Reoviridae sp.]
MSFFNNISYLIDKNFNDFGPHTSIIAPVGKSEVTILDNVYNIAKLIHGRILSSSNISGGFRVYVPKTQVRELIHAYQSIALYKLSSEIDPLIQSLRALLTANGTEVEVGIDSRIVLQIIAVNNGISTHLREIWEGAIALRFISCSGFNKDMTIDGKQQILNSMLSKFSNMEMQTLIPEFERSGQLAGIRCPRQIDTRDMIADMLFSRKDSSATLHDLFHTMIKQRSVLREFRTDILFCPLERYRELELGWTFKVMADINLDGREGSVIKPMRFDRCEYIITNLSLKEYEINVTGSIGSGVIKVKPLQEIRITGTSLIIPKEAESVLKITLIADVRDVIGNGNSIVSLAMKGQLRDDDFMLNIFYQVIKPVIPYLNSLVKRCNENDVLRLCVSKMNKWVQSVFQNLKPGNIYAGWLLSDQNSANERLLYIYLLAIMLPEYLLDPTFTFSDSIGTPPYLHEYGSFVQSLKILYE